MLVRATRRLYRYPAFASPLPRPLRGGTLGAPLRLHSRPSGAAGVSLPSPQSWRGCARGGVAGREAVGIGGGMGAAGPSLVRFRCPRGPSREHAAAAPPFPLPVWAPDARAAFGPPCGPSGAPYSLRAPLEVPARVRASARSRQLCRACAAFPAARTLLRLPPPAGPGAAGDAALPPGRARALRRPLCSRPASRGGAPGALGAGRLRT